MENFAHFFNIEGIADGYSAERDSHSPDPQIVVRDYHGIVAFDLPHDSTVEQINRAVSIYERGFRGGELHAEGAARAKVLKALNIDPAKANTDARVINFPLVPIEARDAGAPIQIRTSMSLIEFLLATLLWFAVCTLVIPTACDWFGVAQIPVEFGVLGGIAAGVALPNLFKRFVKH